jgi:pantoate--beta-alanine ligase
MEGKQRPGHFTGVLTIVMKLLNLVKPHRIYLGEKDYQQFKLIHDMVDAFFMDIKVIPCPTIYEESGLAYSSRNNRLNQEQRNLAIQFAKLFHQALPSELLITKLNEIGVAIEYIEEYWGRRFIAVKIGDIRLIDNYLITC